MLPHLAVVLSLMVHGCFPDLIPEAITVYRNPEFFKNLNQDALVKTNYNQKSSNPSTGTSKHYKYPGETKKPNPPPASPGFEINYDNSPEFHHEPRDIFINTAYKPSRKKGPYSPIHHGDKNLEGSFSWNVKKPSQEDEGNASEESNERDNFSENPDEEPKDFTSFLNSNPDDEFKSYHEPVLLAGTDFNAHLPKSSKYSTGNYNRPYSYNKTRTPVSYEDWKLNAYPKIHSKEHLTSDSSSIYSEEPATNAFDANESHTHDSYEDDEPEDEVLNYFDDNEFKNLGADTKHIYKKLLNPKKFLFKLHSKPKLKKLKLKVKKSHFHNTDWFDEYPFNF